jgi:hypothetical protein
VLVVVELAGFDFSDHGLQRSAHVRDLRGQALEQLLSLGPVPHVPLEGRRQLREKVKSLRAASACSTVLDRWFTVSFICRIDSCCPWWFSKRGVPTSWRWVRGGRQYSRSSSNCESHEMSAPMDVLPTSISQSAGRSLPRLTPEKPSATLRSGVADMIENSAPPAQPWLIICTSCCQGPLRTSARTHACTHTRIGAQTHTPARRARESHSTAPSPRCPDTAPSPQAVPRFGSACTARS